MYLFFDTETTGLPRSWRAPATDVNSWPRMVQIAWILTDARGTPVETASHIIRPAGYTIPPEASAIHRITTERALAEGVELEGVLHRFISAIERAQTVIAHNMGFDAKIVSAECVRLAIPCPLQRKQKLCTMRAATRFCQLPGPYGYKWPKLAELHLKLFGQRFDDPHNALADVEATARCFRRMRGIGWI